MQNVVLDEIWPFAWENLLGLLKAPFKTLYCTRENTSVVCSPCKGERQEWKYR